MSAALRPVFRTTDAANAVNIEPHRLDAWLVRGAFRMGPYDVDANGHGHPRQWSRRTVYKLGIMTALARGGITAARAYTSAEAIMKRCEHISDSLRTYAVIKNGGVVNFAVVDRSQTFEDRMDDLISGSESIVIIDLSRLFAGIDEKLKAVSDFVD